MGRWCVTLKTLLIPSNWLVQINLLVSHILQEKYVSWVSPIVLWVVIISFKNATNNDKCLNENLNLNPDFKLDTFFS